MLHSRLRLAYRQVIDATSMGAFERDVFQDSYQEFLIQIQTYNQDARFTTWQQLRTAIPKADGTLQYKVGFAIGLYVRQLGGKIPGLWDSMGKTNLAFAEHRFELLDSDITDPSAHRVALSYLTEPFKLLGTVGTFLMLQADEEAPLLVEMRSGLGFWAYELL